MVLGEIQCKKVYEDKECFAFKDINPQAPTHILIVPKKHISKLFETQDKVLLGNLLSVANIIAKEEGVEESGYRVVINTNKNAGQTVDHLHIHLLGGRVMKWPPG
jgi:histidine triad (HIT) family protein